MILWPFFFGRNTGPILDLIFQPLNQPENFNGEPPFLDELFLRIHIENTGKRVGKYVEAIVVFPGTDQARIPRVLSGSWDKIDALYPPRQARQFTANTGVFHPKMKKSIVEIAVQVSKAYLESHTSDPFAAWSIYADNMDVREGSVSLYDLGLGGYTPKLT